jgi:hypothetical protein
MSTVGKLHQVKGPFQCASPSDCSKLQRLSYSSPLARSLSVLLDFLGDNIIGKMGRGVGHQQAGSIWEVIYA